MINDLFSQEHSLELLPIPDAEVYYLRQLPLANSPQQTASEFILSTPWRAEQVTVWGKTFPQPRLIAWYGLSGKNYSYSGIKLSPLPWTDALIDIKSRVETASGLQFNSVLLNYYRDHRDSMGFHSDDEPELGARPAIASLSLGEERTLVFKHKKLKIKPVRLLLHSGSLLIMKGDTQANWKHGIEKESKPLGPRVNLTFRTING